MKILVTGSSGQLGQEIMRHSTDSEHEYIFTDARISDAETTVVPLDITDEDSVMQAVAADVDVIINCAAYTDVNRAESDPETAFKVNASAVGNLARAAMKAGALMIHISTDYIFDGRATTPYREDAPAAPINIYGKSKLAGEEAVIDSGCRYMIFRTSWLYSNTGRNFFLTMVDLTAQKSSLKVVVDQIGTPTYAYDLAFFLSTIIEEGKLDYTGVYHYSDEGVCSWYDFAKEICMQLGHTCSIEPCYTEDFPSPAARPHYSVLDKTKVKETFGMEIPHWRESLLMAVREYYRMR